MIIHNIKLTPNHFFMGESMFTFIENLKKFTHQNFKMKQIINLIFKNKYN